jgi:hypothetical protein
MSSAKPLAVRFDLLGSFSIVITSTSKVLTLLGQKHTLTTLWNSSEDSRAELDLGEKAQVTMMDLAGALFFIIWMSLISKLRSPPLLALNQVQRRQRVSQRQQL